MKKSQKTVEAAKTPLPGAMPETDAKARTGANIRNPEQLRQAIAILAYTRAESRQFEPGHEMDDWLEAEREMLAKDEDWKGFPA